MPISATELAKFFGSITSTALGLPVATLQKAQALVQIFPRIMTVACLLDQHSPILGQAASSHTVLRPLSRISLAVSEYPIELGAFTLIQSGFLNTGFSGFLAFSGCRNSLCLLPKFISLSHFLIYLGILSSFEIENMIKIILFS
jgi:hypothetical protein